MSDWLWQGVVSGVLTTVLIAGAGLVLAAIKIRWPSYSGPLLYGLAGSCCVAVLMFTFTGHAIFSPQQTTTGNIEENVKKWCEHFGLSVANRPNPSNYFTLLVTLSNGSVIEVWRSKEIGKDQYLSLTGRLTVSPEYQDIINRLTKQQTEGLTRKLSLELSKQNMQYTLSMTPGVTYIGLLKAVPITSGLTESSYIENLSLIDNGIEIVQSTIFFSVNENMPKS